MVSKGCALERSETRYLFFQDVLKTFQDEIVKPWFEYFSKMTHTITSYPKFLSKIIGLKMSTNHNPPYFRLCHTLDTFNLLIVRRLYPIANNNPSVFTFLLPLKYHWVNFKLCLICPKNRSIREARSL